MGQVGEILLGPFFLEYLVMKRIGIILFLVGIALLLFTIGYFLFWVHWGVGIFVVGLILVAIGGSILEDD